MFARVSVPVGVLVGGLAVILSLGVAATVASACDDCVTVIDVPAWDEHRTVTDIPAWDEQVMVNVPAWFEDTTLDHPAVWVPAVPARTIAHHDLVTAAYTVTETVLLVPAHEQPYDVWVVSYITDYQWVDTSHYVNVWVDTSYDAPYEYWVSAWCWDDWSEGYYDCGYTVYGSRHVSQGYWDSEWVSSGYEQQVRIDTSHNETRYRQVPDVYGTVTYVVPAVYDDWTETIAGVPGYWIPAWSEPLHVFHPDTTRLDIVHHSAVTHDETVHHIAVGHLQRLGAGSTQSAQGAPPVSGGSGTTASIVTEPVRIPIVTTLSLVDRPAYTETVTIVDQPAWDEVQTIIDAPATTTTRTVTDSPARTVQHHDLVTAATSTQVQVLVTPAHDETTSTWVPETTTRYNTTAGQYMQTYVPDQYGPIWLPQNCYWEWDDGGRSWNCDGGYYYNGIVTPAHWENQWHQGHYVYINPRECDDTDDGRVICYYAGWQWVWNDGPFWETVDTSHYVYTTTHYNAVYRTDTVTTPAVYNDWTESIPAVTHQETVPVPAVTHTITIHHDAITHTESVAHATATHDQTLSFDATVVPDQTGTGGDNGLADFAALMGLVALAGAGRLRSTRDVVREALAEWSSAGRSVPLDVACFATNDQLTDAQVADRVAAIERGTSGRAVAASIPDDGSGVPTPAPLYNLSWAARRTWLQSMETTHHLDGWLHVFEGVMDFAEHSIIYGGLSYFRAWDAAVLFSIQQGIAASYSGQATSDPAALAWKSFFDTLQRQQAERSGPSGQSSITDAQLKYLWGTAEQSGVDAGAAWAIAATHPKRLESQIVEELKAVTNKYRTAVRNDDWFSQGFAAFWGIPDAAPQVTVPYHPDPRADRNQIAVAALLLEPQLVIKAARALQSSDPSAALAAFIWSDDPSAAI